jgi:predicted nicotinamide N-methyase
MDTAAWAAPASRVPSAPARPRADGPPACPPRRARGLIERLDIAGRTLAIERPPDAEALFDERAFAEEDEFLPYWAELWPSSLALAEALHERPPRGLRVLELGCGLGVPSVVAALEGAAEVTASDWSPDAVAAAARNAARNGAAVRGLVASWFEPEPLLARAPWDLVIAADVLYEARNVEPLVALVPRLLAPGGEGWVADPQRATSAELLLRLEPVRHGVWRLA